MKQFKIILGLILFASVTTFAQSPRIKLNQITKDSLTGSVLISSPTDSGMVYSRDLFISYGADTVLILGGDTLAATSSIISSVLSDGVTITGDGTIGSELKADTSVIATIKGLVDTLTNRGYLEVSQLTDTLDANTRGFLTANQTITLSGDVTGSGTTAITATVVDDSHNHIISNVDNLQDSLTAKANVSELSNYLLTSNYIVDSTRLNTTGDTAFYYQNGVLIGSQEIAGGGGTTYNNISETADTVYIDKFMNVDTATLYVQSDSNRVGIGTSTPSAKLNVEGGDVNFDSGTFFVDESANEVGIGTTSPNAKMQVNFSSFQIGLLFNNTTNEFGLMGISALGVNKAFIGYSGGNGFYGGESGVGAVIQANGRYVLAIDTFLNVYLGDNTLGPPTEKLDVDGNARFRSIGSGASAGALHYTSTGVLTTNTSDIRLKTNLQPLENTLQKLLNINTYSFNWINETNRVDLGMVAQQVEEIFPRLVFTNPVDGYKGIHYDKFSSILTKAIQEQQSIIESQATEIEQLKTLITELSNRLTILENN